MPFHDIEPLPGHKIEEQCLITFINDNAGEPQQALVFIKMDAHETIGFTFLEFDPGVGKSNC